MATATKAANSYTDVTGTWATQTNAYATTGDDQYATHTQAARNGTAAIRYGFPTFATSDIPDGSTINSVKVSAEVGLNQSIGSFINITIQNPSGTAVGSAVQTTNTADTLIESTATTVPSLTNLRDQTVFAYFLYDRANSNTSETVRIDYVSITVDYTAATPSYRVYAQAQANIKTTYSVYAQAQVQIALTSRYSTSVLNDDPIAYWRLGETSGSIAYDEIGTVDLSHYNVPTINITGLLSADSNKAYQFSTDGAIYKDSPSGLPAGSSTGATFEALVKFTSLPDSIQSIITWGYQDTTPYHWFFYENRTGQTKSLMLQFWTSTDGYVWTYSSEWIPQIDVTYHLAAVHDYAGKTVKFYINGEFHSTFNANGYAQPSSIVANRRVSIGAYFYVYHYAYAVIDEPAIYDYALEASQISNHYINSISIVYAQAQATILVPKTTYSVYAQARVQIAGAAGTPPSRVQAIGGAYTISAVNPLTLSVSKTITEGNKIIVALGRYSLDDDDEAFTDNLGNTYVKERYVYGAYGNLSFWFYVADITTGGTLTSISCTWPDTKGYVSFIAEEWANIGDITTGGEDYENVTVTTTGIWTDPAGITIPINCVVLGAIEPNNPSTTVQPGSASGSPSTTIYEGVGTVSPADPTITFMYTIANETQDVTGFTGTATWGTTSMYTGGAIILHPASGLAVIRGYGQAQAQITATAATTYGGYAQAHAWIKTTYPKPLTTYISDSFSRTVSNGWGTADTGGAYTITGNASYHSVNGSKGLITVASPSTGSHASLDSTVTDTDTSISWELDKLPVNASTYFYIMSRKQSGVSTYYQLAVTVTTAGAISTVLNRAISGSNTNLGSSGALGTYSVGQVWKAKIRVHGDKIYTKVWNPSSAEPSWQVQTTDNSISTYTYSTLYHWTSAITNAPLAVIFDNYLVTSIDDGTTFAQAQAQITAASVGTYRGISQANAAIAGSFTSVVDTFTRTASNEFGTADTGGTYTMYGSIGDVTGSVATITHAAGSSLLAKLERVGIRSFGQTIKYSLDALPTGTDSWVFIGTRGRQNATDEVYSLGDELGIFIDSSGAQNMSWGTFGGGGGTGPGVLDSYTVGQTWILRWESIQTNSDVIIRTKAWNSANSEPSDWLRYFSAKVHWSDPTKYVPVAGHVGIYSHTSSTSASQVIVTLDDWNVYAASGLTVRGQTQARIRQTYRAYAQANAQITISGVARRYAHTRALIFKPFSRIGQAGASIKDSSGVVIYAAFGLGRTSITKPFASANVVTRIIRPNNYTSVHDTFTRTISVYDQNLGTSDDAGPWITPPPISLTSAYIGANGTSAVIQGKEGTGGPVNKWLSEFSTGKIFELNTKFKLSNIGEYSATYPPFKILYAFFRFRTQRVAQQQGGIPTQIVFYNDEIRLDVGASLNDTGIGTAIYSISNPVYLENTSAWYRLKIQIKNTELGLSWANKPKSTTRAKLWEDGDSEPNDWQVEWTIVSGVVDSTSSSDPEGSLELLAYVSPNEILEFDYINIDRIGWTEYAQAQVQIVRFVTYTTYAQAQTQIKQTYRGYAQAQARIKQTYRGHAQAQTWVEATYRGPAQAQARIKKAYQSYAQAQARIKQTYLVYAQTQAWIKATYRGYAQAQTRIKQTYLVYAQANVLIKNTYQAYAQSQALIKNSYLAYAQAQATIEQTYQSYAQAQVFIYKPVTSGIAYAQAQARIKQSYQVVAQAQTWVEQTYRVFAQSQTLVVAPYRGYANAQTTIKAAYSVYAQAQAKINAYNVQSYAQALAYISGQEAGYAQAQAQIKTSYQAYAHVQTTIKQAYQAYAQAQTQIKQIYSNFSQAQGQIKLVKQNTALATVLISGDYNSVIDSFNRTLTDNWGSADTGGAYTVYGGNNTRFDVNGSVGTYIKTPNIYDRVYLPKVLINNSESIIKLTLPRPTSGTYGLYIETHCGSPISNTNFNGYNLAIFTNSVGSISSSLRNKGSLLGSGILVSLGVGETLLVKLKTYQTLSSVTMFAKAWVSGSAEPAGWPLVGNSNTPLPPGFVGIVFPSELMDFSNKTITLDDWNIYTAYLESYAQAQTNIKTTYSGYAQAQSQIKQTYAVHAQSNAQIKQTYQVYAQAGTTIEQTYLVHAQAQIVIKQTYQAYAQAQTSIEQVYQSYAQAQTQVEATYQIYAQGQALIKNTYRAYAQALALIVVRDIQVFAQAGAKIFATGNALGQAEVWIYIPQIARPISDISNDGWVRTVRD